MIFQIPKSQSYLEQFTYKKYLQVHNKQLIHRSNSPHLKQLRPNKLQNRNALFKTSFSQRQIALSRNFVQSPKKLLIYSNKRSKSYDKYLVQNKKLAQKQVILKNMNSEQEKIYLDIQEKKKIYSGKKLVDPIHQRYNYCLQNKSKEKMHFQVTDFLLQPCKINPKKLQSRPYTSDCFHSPQMNDIQPGSQVRQKKRNHSSLTRTRRKEDKSQLNLKFKNGVVQFSTELINPTNKNKSYSLQPWEINPYSNNMDSIKIY